VFERAKEIMDDFVTRNVTIFSRREKEEKVIHLKR
jgi:hypothetical protein